MPEATLAHALAFASREYGDRSAIAIGEHRSTYAQLHSQAWRYARSLAGLGIAKGDHVGLLLPNCIEYLLLNHACGLIGARPVHFNTRYRGDELRYVVDDSDVQLLFTSGTGTASTLVDAFPELDEWNGSDALSLRAAPLLRGVYCFHGDFLRGDSLLGDSFHRDGARGWPDERAFFDAAQSEDPPTNGDPEEIGLVMYTSGTTARPKACLLSHRALETTARAMARRWTISSDDALWDPLPFFHMSTLLPLAACRSTGAAFIGAVEFVAADALQTICEHRATILFPSFPAITNELLAHRDFDAAALSQVRIVNNVGPPDLLRRYAAALPRATHVSAYGLTEAGGVVAFHDPTDTPEQLTTTCGRAFEEVEIRVVDPETLAPLPAEQRGELQIRGPTLFSGYYKDTEKTRATLLDDGWLRTGDLGALSRDGRIRYLGRIKDMLKVGGENVAAIEIESHLATHPAVRIAQVIAAPDERLGEVAAAFIELHPGATLAPAEVVEHCVGRIASFKIPRWVAFVHEWPMSATKIQKHRLRDRLHSATYVGPERDAPRRSPAEVARTENRQL